MSKTCLQELVPELPGSIYATPVAHGSDNARIVETIRDGGFQFNLVGYGGIFHLDCDGWYVYAWNHTAGCKLYENDGTLKFSKRFNIPKSDANGIGSENNH